MPIDLTKSTTFVPAVWILTKLVCTLVLVQLSFEESSGATLALSLRSHSRIPETLLVFLAIQEFPIDGFILSKVEIATHQPHNRRIGSTSVAVDILLAMYLFYSSRPHVVTCQSKNWVPMIALACWAFFSFAVFACDIVPVSFYKSVTPVTLSRCKTFLLCVCLACAAVSWTDPCFLVSKSMLSLHDLNARSVLYAMIVISRYYIKHSTSQNWDLEHISNLILFGHTFVVNVTVFYVFVVGVVFMHVVLLLNLRDETRGSSSNVDMPILPTKAQGAVPDIDAHTLEKLREMEMGLQNLQSNRRRLHPPLF